MKKGRSIIKDIYDKGFFHLFSANSFIHLIEFGSQFFVAWILLADDIGRIKSFQSFSAVSVVIAGIGFNTSILKLCSEKKTPLLQKQILFASAVKITMLFSFITLLIILTLSKFEFISNDSITNKLFVYYALSVPLVALNNLLIAYYQALKAFKKVSVLLIFARIIHIAIIISLTYLYALRGFILGIILGGVISSILLLSKSGFIKAWRKTTKDDFKKNWELAKYAFLANVINMVTLYFDIFLLNHLISNSTELGYYGFALTIISGLRIITTTIQQFVTPFFSEFSNNYEQSRKAFEKANRLLMTIIVITGVVSLLIVPFIIQFIYSGKYDNSIYYFQLLTLAWVVRGIASLKAPFLLAMGYVKIIFYSVLIIFLISVIPYWLLINKYEVLGAVYGQIFTAIVFFVVISLNFKKTMNKIKLKDEKFKEESHLRKSN